MKKTESQILVIFGASGDLTARKLIPAVYQLHKNNLLPKNFAVVGVSRTKMTDDEFRDKVAISNEHLPREEKLDGFHEMLYYQPLNTKDAADYENLRTKLEGIQKEKDISSNYIFYLSTPPSLFDTISHCLKETKLSSQDNGWKRVIIEKPFGYDLETAKELNQRLHQYFEESQIYRIDHYLGKETVQNVLVTRFANSIFEPLWNRNYIDHIEITSAESVGVEKRGGYYDSSGALRDMIQNHLLQLVALIAMEPPTSVSAKYIRDEKTKLFRSLKPLSPDDVKNNVIRGQYLTSKIKGDVVPGYREEEGVDKNSMTETYCAIKFYIDNWRWQGVPFYVRSGKRLPTRVTEIVIHFKPVHYQIFDQNQGNGDNVLILRIQPNEGILLKFGVKVPGEGFKVKDVNMDFHYSELTSTDLPEAYERLLLDCMQGDGTLFARGDAVEAAWEFVEPILKAWKEDPTIKMYGYPAGTWGPEPADDLIEGENEIWRYPCKNLTNDGNFCEL
ncbi:glucose-6-phosphate dehydrogenase [Flammeovirgaceae bacterium SG7u.111]|nr:glucose-6-phosphate dehydrogenase [Flammeovirgaceae bacterium SG7u.132]WPO35092.1 glucose-6-phosphate dehydrogenase [Flammeovirgaceae bacterium SG7u.111]